VDCLLYKCLWQGSHNQGYMDVLTPSYIISNHFRYKLAELYG